MIRLLSGLCIVSLSLVSATLLVGNAIAQSVDDEGPSSTWYNLEVGTVRYYDACMGFQACVGTVVAARARETVLEHVVIEERSYARVEWWTYEEYDEHPFAPSERAVTYLFRMEDAMLLQRVGDVDSLVYNFGFEPGDELAQFVGSVVGEPASDRTMLPAIIQGDTVVTGIEAQTYRTLWGAETYEENMPAPVMMALVDNEPGVMFDPEYADLFYYVEGLGVWYSSFTHWGWPMVGVRAAGTLVGTATSVEGPGVLLPRQIVIHPNYPNPVSSSTDVSFDLAESGQVRVTVVDLLGRVISEITNERLTPGTHRTNIDLSALANGTYFVQVESSGSRATRSITVAR